MFVCTCLTLTLLRMNAWQRQTLGGSSGNDPTAQVLRQRPSARALVTSNLLGRWYLYSAPVWVIIVAFLEATAPHALVNTLWRSELLVLWAEAARQAADEQR